MRYFKFCVVLLFVSLILPDKAEAYLDPGTGSYILQLLIGVFAGALFAIKIFWGKICTTLKSVVSRVRKHDQSEKK